MATLIITGNYTSDAVKGMMANPSDREAAVKPLIEASGGRLVCFYATTGETDFLAIVEGTEGADVIAALMVVGATGTVTNLKTVRGFSSAEFMAIQESAGSLAASFKPAG